MLARRKDARYADAERLHHRREVCARSQCDNQNLGWRINEPDGVTLREVGLSNAGCTGDELGDCTTALFWHRLRGCAPVEGSPFRDVVFAHAWHRPNENKMSDGGRERSSLAVKGWKSSQM